MATTDLEKLVVQLSADFKSYENAMAKASGITRKELASIKAGAAGVGQAAEAGFKRVATAARASQGNVINFRTGMQQLGFQAQDVAVQLSMGTSAMRVFGQQAPQILSVFGPFGAALGVAAAALPLLAAGFLDAGQAAAEFEGVAKSLETALGDLKAAGFEVTEATTLFGAALRNISEATAQNSITAFRSLVSEMATVNESVRGALTDSAIDQDTLALIERSIIEKIAGSLRISEEQAVRLRDAMRDVASTTDGELAAAAQRLVNEIANVAKETGTITPEMKAVSDAAQLAGQAASTLAGNTTAAATEAGKLAGAWQTVLANAQGAMMAAGQAMAAQARAQAAMAAINNSRPTSFGGALGANPGDFPLSGIPGNAISQANSDFPIGGTVIDAGVTGSSGGGRSGGSASVDQALRDQKRIQDELHDAITKLAEDDLERLQDANRRTAETFADLFTGAITGASSLQESLAGIAEQLGNMLLTRGFEALLNGGAGGGIMGAISGFIGGRANGGPVMAGAPYIVGERGPEFFVPNSSGRIVPNGGGGVVLNYSPVIDARGADAAAVARLEAAQRAQSVTFRDNVAAALRDPRRRG